MPFAGYTNFAACIRANKDKKNPNAYCGSIMHAVEGKFHMEEDPHLGAYGITDYEDQKIVINPRMGDVVNTVIHEKIHMMQPEMPHDEVYKKAHMVESNMSVREMAQMLSETADEIDGPHHMMTRTVASKVVKSNIK